MKRYTSLFSLIILTALLATPVLGQDTRTIIVDQPDSPISITKFSAEYQERDSYQSEGVRQDVEFENTSSRNVVALEFGFVMFSVFNEFLDTASGVTLDDLEAGESDDGAWVTDFLNAFTFHTGVAFMRQLRYENGEIWEADMSVIEERVQKIQSEFDASQLEKDEGESE